MNIKYYDLVILGAGVSGSFCALNANNKIKVALIEKNNQILKKFMITGKGKSNIANTSDTNQFLKNLIGSNKFLYPSLHHFNGINILSFLLENKLQFYEKEPHRFHLSSTNEEFRRVMLKQLSLNHNLDILLNTEINKITKQDDNFILEDKKNQYYIKTKYLIVATGGLSFKNTGSNGFGYEIAKQFNHHIKPLFPIGVGLIINDQKLIKLQGISLDNVLVKVYENNQLIYQETGSIMFTHYGLGGPVIRRVSGYVSYGLINNQKMSIKVDYLNLNHLENELNNHQYLNQCFKEINKKIIESFLNYDTYNIDLKNINKQQKLAIIQAFHNVEYNITQTDSIDVAINTGGGVDLKEIDPNSYESRIIKNLFFIGETIDINPRTNGYNITSCFSMAKKCIDYLNKKFN